MPQVSEKNDRDEAAGASTEQNSAEQNLQQEFEISDANADIDAALLAIEHVQFTNRTILRDGARTQVGPTRESELLTHSLERLERAVEAIFEGKISRELVNWVRCAIEEQLGSKAKAAAWLPEAGNYVVPATAVELSQIYASQDRDVTVRDAGVASLPQNPEIERVFKDLNLERGTIVRPYDQTVDALTPEEARHLIASLHKIGLRVEELGPDFDMESYLARPYVSFDPESSSLSLADDVAQRVREGRHVAYHATSLLQHALLDGRWITSDLPRVWGGSAQPQCDGFHMALSLDWKFDEQSGSGLSEYFEANGLSDVLKKGGLELGEAASELDNKGILLEVDLRGYAAYLQSARLPGFALGDGGEHLIAPCPPPRGFIRPIAVIEFAARA